MKKYLKINSFYDEFSIHNFNCMDLTLAMIIARRNDLYYYSYLLLNSLILNFNYLNKNDNSFTMQDHILNQSFCLDFLGINKKQLKFDNIKSFRDKVYSCINAEQPVLIDVSYQTLYFYKNYKDPSETKLTTLVINGYNAENDTVTVLDMSLERDIFSSLFKGEFLYTLQLPLDHLYKILEESKKLLEERGDYFSEEVLSQTYVLENRQDSLSLDTLNKTIVDILSGSKDFLTEEIKKLTDVSKFNPKNIENLMKFYGNSYYVIIRCIFYIFSDRNSYPFEQEMLIKFSQKRKSLLTKYSIHYFKKHCLSQEEVTLLTDEINKNNENLLAYFKSVILNERDRVTEFNYIKEAKITCSSEFTPAAYMKEADINPNLCWFSLAARINHWIAFDFSEAKEINNIKIIHYGKKELNTRSYKILGSNDNENWELLSEVSGNIEDFNEISLNKQKFQYIKIEIIEPCIADNRARIRNVIIN